MIRPRSDATTPDRDQGIVAGLPPGRTVVTVAASLIAASLPVFLLSALAPAIQQDLGFGEAGLGFAVASFFLAAAISSVPGGRFADRFGAAVSLRTGLGIAAAGCLAVALLAGSRWSLTAAMFLGGSALGFVDTGGARAIASAVPVARQGIAFGSKEASIPAASFLAGASVPVVGAQLGWRPAFAVGVGLAGAVGVLVSRRLERPPVPATAEDHERPPDDRATVVAVPPSIWPLLLLSVTAALGGGAAAATTAFLVASSVAGGLAPSAAGTLLAGASAVAIVSRLVAGAAADRRPGAAVTMVAGMLAVGSVGGAGLALGATGGALPTAWLPVVLVVAATLSIGAGWGWTGLVFLAAVRLDASRPAKAAGIVLAGLGVGGAVGPALFGAVAGRAGYVTAWTAATVALISAALTAVAANRLARSGPRHSHH